MAALQEAAAGTYIGKETRKVERAHSAAEAKRRGDASADEIVANMSLKELKELLTSKNVDFSRCVEKSEFRALAIACLASNS